MTTASEEPVELDRFEAVLLIRPDDAPALSSSEAARIQAAHIAHLTEMEAQGHMRLCGPFDEQRDESLRGLSLYTTGSLERARELAEADPAVLAGVFRVDVMYFYCRKGAL